MRFINSLGLKISARPVGGGTKIADVQAKHGKADRTETLAANQELVRLKACTLDAIVHWYGQYGFCVAPSETEVFGLVFVKKAS